MSCGGCGYRVGLRDGSCRSRVVATSRRGQQQDFKLSPRVLAASLTAWAVAKSLASHCFFFFLKSLSLSLSCLSLRFSFLFFSFGFPFGLRRLESSVRLLGLHFWTKIFFFFFLHVGWPVGLERPKSSFFFSFFFLN